MSDLVECCVACNSIIKNKRYEYCLCADCRVEVLEREIKFQKEQFKDSQNRVNNWISKYNEESILKIKYKHAFDALFEKINSKQ